MEFPGLQGDVCKLYPVLDAHANQIAFTPGMWLIELKFVGRDFL